LATRPSSEGVPEADPALGVARSLAGRAWHWRHDRLELAATARLGVADLTARLLLSRGAAPQDLPHLLAPSLRHWLPDPSAFRDMDKAAARIADAVTGGEAITVFADYDVDGATSAAILIRHLRALGARPSHYIPDRLLEGYGPSTDVLLRLRREGTSLLLLLDCGTQAFAELEAARAAGLDVIVVDHHKASTQLPPALALVNPNRFDEQADGGPAAQHGHLCTAGLAFLLAVAVQRELRRRGFFRAAEPDLAAFLDLVALGTVADVMPLTGLNRAFVALGLRRLAARGNPGLAALLDVAGLSRADAHALGFALGPRVNAGGRVGTADLGVRLLTTSCADEAARLARELDALNAARRQIEAEVTQAALAAADASAPVVIAAGEGWHPGVIGIVASRLKERLRRPAIVIATDGDRPGRGSGRSVAGVDLGAAILEAKERGLLLAGGGHAMAAGLTVAPASIAALGQFLSHRLGPAIAEASARSSLAIDLAVTANALTPALAEALEAAGPYGRGWPYPRVVVGPARLVACATAGDGRHVRIVAAGRGGGRVKAILFQGTDTPLGQQLLAGRGRQFQLAGRVVRNDWQGQTRAELHLDDAAGAD
jgi:single-stranded-DNA-specific exonuclease